MPLEEFVYSGTKKLRMGFTTGTCATLASMAAARKLLLGSWPETVSVITPKGIKVEVSPEECRMEGDDAVCAVRKDGGDDIDVTSGSLIEARVSLISWNEILIDGGRGVGRVTKPGLDQPVGNAAINHVPRQMITKALEDIAVLADYSGGFKVTICVPDGEEIAVKTFNSGLGIIGGISILGTSGIVEPMSMQALIDSIKVKISQVHAEGSRNIIMTPGNYGMDFIKDNGFVLPDIPIIKISNFLGDALDEAVIKGFDNILLIGHAGKLSKVAGGIMNTHSRYADCRTELFTAFAAVNGASTDVCTRLMEAVSSDSCIDILDETGYRQKVLASMAEAIDSHLEHRTGGAFNIGAIMFSNEYGELVRTENAQKILDLWENKVALT